MEGAISCFCFLFSECGQSPPSLWLAGGGVQGAFLLDGDEIRPAYQQDVLAKAYDRYDLS